MADVKKVAVIGAGQMGGGIAQIAAQAGVEAVVFDTIDASIENCRKTREKLFTRAVQKERMTQAEADQAQARISYTQSHDDLKGADWVIEAVVEDAKVKFELFASLARLFPEENVVLATNTSSISITEIATHAGMAGNGASRVVGMHFFNPVPVMPLVEVISGMQTADSVVERTVAFAEALGKTPLKANDRPGFVSNRVLMPLINEAFYALMEGVADAESIDGVMRLGCNFPMGPLRLADFIGLDTCMSIMNVLHEGLGNPKYAPCPLLRQYVAAGRLGDKTGRGVYDHSKS